MKNLVLGSLLFVAVVAASEAKAVGSITCKGGDVTIRVDIDVLESLPPQSMVTVKRNGKDWGSYSAFTDYREMETFPVQYYWGFADRNSNRILTVSTTKAPTRGARSARGTFKYNPATSPLVLNCLLY